MKKLPAIVEDQGKSTTNPATATQKTDDMRIAWRYNNLEKINSEQGATNTADGKMGYFFDLSQSIDSDALSNIDSVLFGDDQLVKGVEENTNPLFTNQIYVNLLTKLKAQLDSDAFKLSSKSTESTEKDGPKKLLRVCLKSLCSPLWYENNHVEDICLFFTILKSLIRNTLSVCFITIPAHLLKHVRELNFFFVLIEATLKTFVCFLFSVLIGW